MVILEEGTDYIFTLKFGFAYDADIPMFKDVVENAFASLGEVIVNWPDYLDGMDNFTPDTEYSVEVGFTPAADTDDSIISAIKKTIKKDALESGFSLILLEIEEISDIQ